MKNVNKTEAEILRRKAEESLKKRPAGSGSPLPEAGTQKLIHELEVHQIELEMQNEELKKAKSAAQDTSEKFIELYDELYDFAPSGYFTLSKEGKIIELNFSGANMFGEKRSRLKNSLFRFFITNDTRPTFNLFLDKVFGSKVKETCEVTVLANGKVPMYVYLTAIASPDRKQCLVNVVDITEREKAGEELRESEERYRTLFTSMTEGFTLNRAIYNEDGEFVDLLVLEANSAAEKANGLKREEFVGKTWRQLWPGAEEYWWEICNNVLLNGEEVNFDNYASAHDRWYSVHHFRAGKDLLGSTFTDITASRQALKALQESEEKLREAQEKLNLALENGNIGIWERDLQTNRSIWDRQTQKMFGIKEGSFDGTYEAFEKCLVEEDIPHTREAIRKAIEEKAPYETIYRVRLKNGNISYINSKGFVVVDGAGNAVKLAGVCFDITDMKKGAEEALFKLNEELLRSNKELEQFAYVASHDLQEPLRMVSSFTQLLAERYNDELDENAQKFIYYAREGALRSQGLINDLLNFSRVGTKDQKLTAVDFNKVTGIALNNLSATIEEKNAVVTFSELPTVIGDEGQMVQLMQNLVGNALKFCYTEPRVQISAKEEDNHFLFSVQDNGIGIEEHYFDRVFLIFQRLVPKDEYGGTGIGLAICKRIVERNGGKIWIESQLGVGTTFYFTIAKDQRI